MRILPIFSAVFLTVASPVAAQVTVDLHALQALPQRPGTGHAARPAQQASPGHPVPNAQTTAAPPSTGSTQTAITRVPPLTAQQPSAVQPDLPEAVPDTAAITPIAPALPSAQAPPPPPAVSDTAKTKAAATATGLRLTFAPGQADLSAESVASLKQLTEATPPTDTTTYTVLAYAPGKADDPSTARRISLSRAMAVRSALLADGVPSARIAARALGDQFGDGPPDRVDLSITGTTANPVTAK
jgi:outer membrane protein OmpA-like peptidoglycan-associated protein